MNFQNVPRSDKVVKRAFVPKLDAFCFFDYKQIEPRLLAYYMYHNGDTLLRDRLVSGADTYTAIVEQYYGRTDITEEERQTGKVLFLSLMYGGGLPTMFRQFPDMPRGWHRQTLNQFHDAWPGIRKLQHMIDVVMEERGYIKTLWGRHLRTAESHKRLNALIQGGAADLMKYALQETATGLVGWKSHIVNVVHDEIIIDAALDEVPALMENVPKWMDYTPISQDVPILVDREWSTDSWADKESYMEVSVV